MKHFSTVRAAAAFLTLTLPAFPQGGFVPGQKRPPGDPVQIARGKTIYGVGCTACHGADLRGGDIGGPNLLRSQAALSDKSGEMIVPIIQGSRQATGMPKIDMSQDDALAVSAYVRSVLETIGGQGMPPATGKAPEKIVIGDAEAGEAYFATKCAACHTVTGDLKGLTTRFPEPRALQNAWVGGGARRRGPQTPSKARIITASVTDASGEKVEGRVMRIDDFLISLRLEDDTIRTFTRFGGKPKVELRDPMKVHRDLLSVYTDTDIHNVTAYLVTLK